MLDFLARASVSRVTNPVGAWLVQRGLTPNAITVFGTVGTSGAALWFFPRDELFVGTVVITAFVLFDLLDGAMARAKGNGTRFGVVLDASCDRIADGVLFGALVWWCFVRAADQSLAAAALVCLVCAQVISYVKARAEAAGLPAPGGLVERAERLLIVLVGTGLHGLGVPYALAVLLWALAALSVVTVAQRVASVARSAREGGP